MSLSRRRVLPRFVVTLLTTYRGWLVGSAGAYLAGDTDVQPKDFDVIINPDAWCDVMRSVQTQMECPDFNTFGGLKVRVDGHNIDIWPARLEDMVTTGVDFTAFRLLPRAIVRGRRT